MTYRLVIQLTVKLQGIGERVFKNRVKNTSKLGSKMVKIVYLEKFFFFFSIYKGSEVGSISELLQLRHSSET